MIRDESLVRDVQPTATFRQTKELVNQKMLNEAFNRPTKGFSLRDHRFQTLEAMREEFTEFVEDNFPEGLFRSTAIARMDESIAALRLSIEASSKSN